MTSCNKSMTIFIHEYLKCLFLILVIMDYSYNQNLVSKKNLNINIKKCLLTQKCWPVVQCIYSIYLARTPFVALWENMINLWHLSVPPFSSFACEAFCFVLICVLFSAVVTCAPFSTVHFLYASLSIDIIVYSTLGSASLFNDLCNLSSLSVTTYCSTVKPVFIMTV